MNAQRLAQVQDIYHAVLEIAPDEWPSFLTSQCGDDDDLRQEIESLLSFSDAASPLMDTPPMDIAAAFLHKRRESDLSGTTINHYKILSKIDSGGMGDVYLAEDIKLERQVAIKFIKAEFAARADQLRRFLREAKTASSLNHPNIITVHEIGENDGIQFITTEFIDGMTLRKALGEKALSHKEMLGVAAQVATALGAAHEAGIFHRDIKPENIMLRSDGLAKVLDFGLAKLANTPRIERPNAARIKVESAIDLQSTSPGLVMGTAAYMSPEQARVTEADARSDIWSLGVVMFEMFAGHKPFAGNTSGKMIASILNNEPADLGDSVDPELKRIIYKAIRKEPENRYQTAGELLRDINGINQDRALDREQRSRLNHFAAQVNQHRAISVAVMTLIIIAFSLALYWGISRPGQAVNSVAVMPFENDTGDANSEYLSDGMSEAIINELSQLSGIKVIARGSSFKYKGQTIDLQQVARELGAQAVLTGRVTQRDSHLQVSSELVKVSDNSQIWGGQFDRKPTEFAQIQSEIVGQIIGRLGLAIANNDRQQIVAENNADPRAYELLLKGRFFHSKGNEAGAKKAIEYYEQAIAIDPNYGLSYAAAATSHLYLGVNGFQDPKEPLAKAETSARRAQELNPNLAEVHLAVAGINQFSWNWSEAGGEYIRAIDLNPNLASAHFRYSLYLATQGRHEDALAEMRRARELDPLRKSINLDMALLLYFARQYDAALEQNAIGLELDPEYGGGHYGRGLINTAKGNFPDAIDDYKQFIRLNGDHMGVNCYLGFALAKAGRVHEAKAILRRLEMGSEYVSPAELAILYVGLGEKEKALNTLERAFEKRDPQMQYLGIEPNFDDIRSEPRFAELVRKVGLPS